MPHSFPTRRSSNLIPIRFTFRPAVINNVPELFLRVVNDRMVSRAGSDLRILLQDGSTALKRPKRRVRDGIGHPLIRSHPAPFRPHKLIFYYPDEHERPSTVILWGHLPAHCP